MTEIAKKSPSGSPLGGIVAALLNGTWPDLVVVAMEPADAAAALIARKQTSLEHIDSECLVLLEQFRFQIFETPAAEFDTQMLHLAQLLAIIQRLEPESTVIELHRRFMLWNGFFANFVVDASLDLRREYWRLLAATQDTAAEAGMAARRLMPMWLSICGEAGAGGLYHESYLRVALMGLRRLPLGSDFSSNETFALQGLARWAANRKPPKDLFMRQWRILEGDFPRTGEYWHSEVEAVVAAIENELRENSKDRNLSFSAAQWWREDVDTGHDPTKANAASVMPVPKKVWEPVFKDLNAPLLNIRKKVEQIIHKSRQHAEFTGDTFYIVRTACKFGMKVIKTGAPEETKQRGELAAQLAQTAMEYQPGNEFSWSLYRDALVAAGRLWDAELVGWETIRRFPADVQWRNQLATVLAGPLGKPEEAAALLRETVGLFPADAHARTQLATVLAGPLGKPEEAAALLRETVGLFPADAHARSQLATVLADDLRDIGQARQVLQDAETAGAGDDATITLKQKLDRGRPLRGQPKHSGVPAESLPQQLDLPGAEARRQLFLVENGLSSAPVALEELRKLARNDYVTYAIAQLEEGRLPDTGFSLAFEQAARKGSADALMALIARSSTAEKTIVNSAISLFQPKTRVEKPASPSNADNIITLADFIASARELPQEIQLKRIRSVAGALLAVGPISLAA